MAEIFFCHNLCSFICKTGSLEYQILKTKQTFLKFVAADQQQAEKICTLNGEYHLYSIKRIIAALYVMHIE